MQGSAAIFFALFALVLAGLYLAIRREWTSPGLAAALGVVLSIVTMTLFALAQGNGPLPAVIVGILVGTMFSGATLAVAWYFHSSQMRAQYYADTEAYEQDESVVEEGY